MRLFFLFFEQSATISTSPNLRSPPPLLPSPAVSRDTKHHDSGAGSGSSAAALQTFHILLRIHCSLVALSGSFPLQSGGLPASGRPRFSKIAVHASFTQLQPLLPTSPAGRCATRGPGACGALLPANGSLFGLARRPPRIQGKASSPRLECGNHPCYQQRS